MHTFGRKISRPLSLRAHFAAARVLRIGAMVAGVSFAIVVSPAQAADQGQYQYQPRALSVSPQPPGSDTTVAAALAPLDPRQDGGIPMAVFWREIFPSLLLPLAIAVALSFGHAQLRREVRRRREAELRLEAARDLADSASLAKSAFFATMTHEIRTPLSGIIGMLDLLKRNATGGEQHQMLSAVDTAANSLLNILDDVLDFSKVEANRMSLESIPVDLRTMAQTVIMVIGEPARRRGVKTVLHVDDAVGRIMGDPLRIRQILSNLVSNAAKFTHQGQVVLTLSADRATSSEQWLRFTVRDTGIGIAQDRLAQLMVPYRQADAAISRQYGGTGLGLSVCSRLATLMGGRLHLHSTQGQGTTAEFTCRFRVAQHASPHVAPHVDMPVDTGIVRNGEPPLPHAARAMVSDAGDAGHVRPAGTIDKPLILVVDDHAINRELMRRQLAALGYPCDVKEDAQSALEALVLTPYAMLLTDSQMPPMNGDELARRWRAVESHGSGGDARRMPIVVMTAGQDRSAPAAPGDIDAWLFKPVKLEELRQVLSQWLPMPAVSAAQLSEPWMQGGGVAMPVRAAGVDFDSLRRQFGSNAVARQFARQSCQLLQADLAQATGPLCSRFYDDFDRWRHRALGALGMLGHWPVIETGDRLEKTLRQPPERGADPLADIASFLLEFEHTLRQVERQVEGDGNVAAEGA